MITDENYTVLKISVLNENMDDDKTSLEVILGTYEEFLLGYKCFPKNNDIEQTFAGHSHSASIRCVSTSGKYLASGGADDRIFVYDLQLRKEHTVLTHHTGTVNCLAFTPEHTHLITGSDDGVLAIVRVGNWQLEKTWDKAHKGSAILDVAIHPSGKLALTLGADHCLCTWNLVKGRQAYVINLNSKSKDPKNLDKITWDPSGIRFVLSGGLYTEIWSIETGGVLKSIQHKYKVICTSWISNDTLLIGYESGKLAKVNSDTGNIEEYEGHTGRVKCMTVHNDYIVTGASKGDIKIWDKDLQLLLESNSGCRITCLCVTDMVTEHPVPKEDSGDEQVEVLAPVPTKAMRRGVVTEEHDSDTEVVVPKKKSKKKNHKNSST